jgi:hypothetical protein
MLCGGSMAKKKFDELDAQAEREGNAIKRKLVIKRPMGKRIMKIRRGHQNGLTLVETRIDKRYLV